MVVQDLFSCVGAITQHLIVYSMIGRTIHQIETTLQSVALNRMKDRGMGERIQKSNDLLLTITTL